LWIFCGLDVERSFGSEKVILFIEIVMTRDVMTDANILQGAIFHEDTGEDTVRMDVVESGQCESQKDSGENCLNASQSKPKQLKDQIKPAAHRVSLQSIIFKTFQYSSIVYPNVF